MIRGLTDKGGRFPVIGELRKGGVKTDSNRPGPDLDHFRFTSKDESLIVGFERAFGREPRVIPVTFAYKTTEENFEAWQEEWVRGGLVHRCDREICVAWRDSKGNIVHADEENPGIRCPGRCKPVGRLYVVVPALERLATVVVLTTSTHDILRLQQSLQALESIRGDLRGVPFELSRQPREISVPEGGKRVRRVKNLLHLEVAPHFVAYQLIEMQRAAGALLPADITEMEEEEDTAEEIRHVEVEERPRWQRECASLWGKLRRAAVEAFDSPTKMLAHLIDFAHARGWPYERIEGLTSVSEEHLEIYAKSLADRLAALSN
ncbi:MAG: hypothetical protein AB1631_29605 [Acidobacteriota bacterium]